MSWISGWWKGEKKEVQKEVQKVEDVPELGDDDKNIKNLVESFIYDGKNGRTKLYFKPLIGPDYFKDYIKVDSENKNYIEYTGDGDGVYFTTTTNPSIYLYFDKVTIKENQTAIELNYLKDIEYFRFVYKNGNQYTSRNKETQYIYQYTTLLQLINMNPEDETIPALASVNDVPEVQITGNYVSAVLTNFKNFDKEDDVSKCKTNVVLSGSLNSFYNAGSNKILPKDFGSGNTQWTVVSVNNVVKTGVNDENNTEIIIGFENESTLDLSVISNPILTNTYWTNFYVRNVTMTSETDSTLPFSYYDGDTLRDSTIDYVISKIEETTSGNFQVLTIYLYSQNGNDFLDKYVVNGELQFDVRSTKLDSVVQRLTSTQFQRCLIVVEQMVREEKGNEFEIRCCSKQVSGANVTCSSGTASCEVIPDYKITNLCCINTSDLNLKLDLNKQLPEASITLSTISQNTEFTYDNLYLTNLKKVGATNTNLLLEGNITSLYQYLPLKRNEYPEGYPAILKDIDTINDSPVPNEYLDANISMCLIDIEDAKDIDISKFGEDVNEEDGSIMNQNVFISSILAYDNADIKDKFTKSKLKSRNQAVSHGVTLGDGEAEYADTRYRFGNPNLVQSITSSDEIDYDAIQLYFANQYNSEFLCSEITKDGDDWNLIIDLNNKPTNPNDPESPSTSAQFRSMMNDNDSLLLFVKRLETIHNIGFWNGKSVTNIQIYYYDENGEYVSEPKMFTNFKTKIADAYHAATYEGEDNKIYLFPVPYKFNTENKTITNFTGGYENVIDIINNLYVTGTKFANNNGKVIRSQKINLFVNGEMPAWVFKEVLPLTVEVGTKTHYRFIKSDGTIRLSDEHDVDDVQIIGINDKPNIENVLFPTVDRTIYTGSSIDLSNISDGTAVANKKILEERMYIDKNKVFFVNEVTLLKRFEKDIDITGVFQYYEGTELKDCVYNVEDPSKSGITYADDWALKLPECYEGCNIDKVDTSLLVMNFGTYEQFEPEAYLLKNVVKEDDVYLDVSMSEIDVSNVSKIKLILDKIKYFISGQPEKEFGFFGDKEILNIIYVLFNDNGFIGTESFNYSDLKSNGLIDVINKCYIIAGNNGLKDSVRLIEPLKNIFIEYNNKKCVVFKYEILYEYKLETNDNYRITNAYNDYHFYEINLLVAGEIPSWVLEYMPLPIKLNYVTQDSNYGWIFELSKDKTNMTGHRIVSVNALPTPDGDVGIDNVN